MSAPIITRSVGAEDVAELGKLFNTQRNTRRCWCTAFCSTGSQFASGWLLGRNRRRFEELAAAAPTPMGLLAVQDGEPIGWCACGPRSRYAGSPRSTVIRSRDRAEDARVWLLPCLFVRAGSRGEGVTHALVAAAVDLARREGAAAIEGWPLAASVRASGDAFFGREQVFDELGFVCVDRPSPDRVIMRLELGGG